MTMANKLTIYHACVGAVAVGLVTMPNMALANVRGHSDQIVSLDAFRAMRADAGWDLIAGKLHEWAELAQDWDGDGAQPPHPEAVQSARATLDELQYVQAPLPRATIATDGEIAFEWSKNGGFASISFTDDLHVIAFLREDEQSPVLRIDEPYALEILRPFVERIGAFA